MGRPKSDVAVEPNYDDIYEYLSTGSYPDQMKGDTGKKVNFKRVCSKFAIVDGVLHYRHKKHRNQKEGKN
jgi:hypothetical protein